jgi:Lrp/AsnC family transcriptional regulator, leucine-responsive regulatory protein
MFRHPAQDLDPVDVALLRRLQADCKASLARLGEEVGLSAPAVMKRLRKLEAAGFVRGYHAELDSRALGLDITAFVGLSINFPKNIEEFTRILEDLDEVQECHHVTGRHSLLLKVRARDTHALEDLISRLQRIDAVQATETNIVLSTRKESFKVPLDHLASKQIAETVQRDLH